MLIYIKLRPVAADLFQVDGQKDRQAGMTKLPFVFRNFSNEPNYK